MNAKTENALALENRPEGSLHAPMRIVPYGYGRRDDDDDDIDDLGSSEAPPPWAPSALAQVEGSEGAADHHHQRLSPVESGDDFTRDALNALDALEAHASSSANDHIALMVRLGETLARARDRVGHGKFTRWCEENLKRRPSWCSACQSASKSRP